METRAKDEITLHPHPDKRIFRAIETFMTMTYHHPDGMRKAVYAAGAASVGLILSPLWVPMIGFDLPFGTLATVTAGLIGGVTSLAGYIAQHHIFGFPVQKEDQPYKVLDGVKISYRTATAEMIVRDKYMPLLKITADNPRDAGFVEGYMLGPAMKEMIDKTSFLYTLMRIFMHAPDNDYQLEMCLSNVLSTIPLKYQHEMSGKVQGYNAWQTQAHPNAPKLSYARYALLQVLPDIRNYNPFPQPDVGGRISSWLSMVRKSLKLPGASSVFHSFAPEIGCTTVAHRVGKYLFAIRILDWPGHNSGGRFFLQIDRNICGTTRTIDLTVPVVQGALTVINQSGTFYEMNIAPGDQVGRARGMPAVFFNRLAAEMADNVDEMEQLLQTFQPLGPYHLTAINGVDARTYHFYLSDSERDQHEVEILLPDQTQPQILVVANNGLKHKDDKLVPVNHRDSDERKQNIYQFFSRERVRTALQRKIYEQADGKKLSKASIEEVLALNLECARLALVNNSESVCCMLGVYYEDQLIYARAAVDNLYAQSKDMADFKELTVPLFMSK